MKRVATPALLLCAAVTLTGCAMCCGPYLDHYPTFGGKVQRSDPAWGRVGSIFTDPYTAGTGPLADSNLEIYKPKSPTDRVPLIDEQKGPEPEDLPSPRRDSQTNRQLPAAPPVGWRAGSGVR